MGRKGKRKFFNLFDALATLKTYYKLSDVEDIARRYFVIGLFDGVLTSLGVITGIWMTKGTKITLLSTILGSGLALSISSAWGAWEAESHEAEIKRKEMELKLHRSLKGTLIQKLSTFSIAWTSFVHGVAPLIGILLPVIPFLFSYSYLSFLLSIIIGFLLLFITGLVMGKISKQNVIVSGLRMVFAGLITFIITYFLGIH